MNFNLRKPCLDCPFIKDGVMNRTLEKVRFEGIVKEITHEDKTFQCHKTLPYYAKNVEAQHCAGALIYLEKHGNTDRNFMLRIAKGTGKYEPQNLDLSANVVDELKFEFCVETREMVRVENNIEDKE